jgi:hypothetical protein
MPSPANLPLQITRLAEAIATAALDVEPSLTAKHRCVAMALALVLLAEEAGADVDSAILFAKELAQRARS